MKKTLCLAFTSISLISFSSHASTFTDPIDGMFDMGEYLAENAYGFLPVPIVITEPAVGFGAGMFGVFLHENEQEKEKRKKQALHSLDGGARLIPPAVTVFGGAATENGTWFAAFGHRRTWKQDSIRYMGGAGYGNAFVDVGGLFERTIETDTKGLGGIQHLQFRMDDSDLFLGFSQSYIRSEIRSSNNFVDAIFKRRFGESSTTSGLGITLEYDTTNSFFFPTEGMSIETEYKWYRDVFGSDFEYDTFAFSVTKYQPLSSRFTLVGYATLDSLEQKEESNAPNFPGLSQPPLAKPYIDMRGIAAYAYSGDTVSTLQAQLMWHIDPRWSLLGFGGVGSVADQASNLYSENEWAYGVGFRYQFARRYGIHMGMDFAFSDDENAFYFNLGSGF
ncbi:BamA/TamA family outer membrane protein [Vibrio agarivorans]|uniref:BamA/TamA family outer membrane protein n=1 Tax=Vibrio agarivorans TaxID=153622 RepID=UPI00222E9C00|nr:BamA/TamA family outer membrane protein [Vibrio agarivorans]